MNGYWFGTVGIVCVTLMVIVQAWVTAKYGNRDKDDK